MQLKARVPWNRWIMYQFSSITGSRTNEYAQIYAVSTRSESRSTSIDVLSIESSSSRNVFTNTMCVVLNSAWWRSNCIMQCVIQFVAPCRDLSHTITGIPYEFHRQSYASFPTFRWPWDNVAYALLEYYFKYISQGAGVECDANVVTTHVQIAFGRCRRVVTFFA